MGAVHVLLHHDHNQVEPTTLAHQKMSPKWSSTLTNLSTAVEKLVEATTLSQLMVTNTNRIMNSETDLDEARD